MILLPTLNRIEKLKVFIKSAVETGTSTPGLVLIDKDDYLANQDEYLKLESQLFPRAWKIHITKTRGMGAKVREVWGVVRESRYVGLLNDDHVCVTHNWDTKLIKHLNGKNFVSCNDRYQAPARAAGVTLWSMPLLESVGWPIFPPQIEHLGIDDVWELLGRATGCWKVDMDVIVEHRHVLMGAAKDHTHKLTYGDVAWENSPACLDVQARLKLFVELEFPKAVENVKTLTRVDYFSRIPREDHRMAKP